MSETIEELRKRVNGLEDIISHEIVKSLPLKFKKLTPDAVTPTKAHWDDAGYDMVATKIKETDKYVQYYTGIAMEIPTGYVGILVPRSSVTDTDFMLKNSVGIIDAGYRGDIRFRFKKNIHEEHFVSYEDPENPEYVREGYVSRYIFRDKQVVYKVGDAIGQIVFLKLPNFHLVEVNELDESERGKKGYGSTTGRPLPPEPPKARILRDGKFPVPPKKNNK